MVTIVLKDIRSHPSVSFFHFLLKMKWSKIFLFPFLMLAGSSWRAKQSLPPTRKGNGIQIFDLIISWRLQDAHIFPFFPFYCFLSRKQKEKEEWRCVKRLWSVSVSECAFKRRSKDRFALHRRSHYSLDIMANHFLLSLSSYWLSPWWKRRKNNDGLSREWIQGLLLSHWSGI